MTDQTVDAVRVAEPDGAPRIAALDVLRGLAILGILFMNINDMGQSFSDPDIRHLGWSAADQVAWWIRAVLADGTARALLEMLFGAGMVILTERIGRTVDDWTVLKRYYWRNAVLWLFGIVHMFILLWPGDILHTYAIAAMIAFWFRRLPPRWMIAIGLIGATLQLGGAGYFGVYQASQERAVLAALAAKREAGASLDAAETKTLARAVEKATKRAKAEADHEAVVVSEDEARSGSTIEWVGAQVAKSVERLDGSEIGAIWEAVGTMLIGAALFRLGILQGARSRRFLTRMTLTAYAVGLPLRWLGAYEATRFTDDPHISWATSEYARLAMTLVHQLEERAAGSALPRSASAWASPRRWSACERKGCLGEMGRL